MSPRIQALLWITQRVTAMVLVPCVAIHLVTFIYAVQSGLSAAEILARTQGNPVWAAFYALFVTAVALHALIGLRGILSEWFRWRGWSLEVFAGLAAIALATYGWRAVWAVYT